ncbi:MAG: transglutaminase domain-containing protein [Bacteroidota bacterium]|jgi:transglutaminase/protease-like cytokinesis protein 3
MKLDYRTLLSVACRLISATAIFLGLFIFLLSSCVTKKSFEEFVKNDSIEVAYLKNKITEIESVNSKQLRKIRDLQEAQSELKNQISIDAVQIINLKEQISDLRANIQKVQSDVTKLEDRITVIEKYKEEQEFFKNNIDFGSNQSDVSKIDDYVLNLNTNDFSTSNYSDLVQLITNNSNSSYEKARSIFIWLANNIEYDVSYQIYDADRTFLNRRGVCAGYSALFEKFCKLAGLNVVTIIGTAKVATYTRGASLNNSSHAWNAVMDDSGRWIFVDATWGAGSVNGGVFTRKIASYWFDSDPSIFALSHFPEEEQWQLLDQPLLKNEFLLFPPLYPNVALMGLKGSEILNHLRNDPEHSFPHMYTFEGLLKINQIPLTEKLSSDEQYMFSFTTPKEYKIALIQEGEWSYLSDRNNVKEISIKPQRGSLVVAINTGEKETFSYLFVYKIE